MGTKRFWAACLVTPMLRPMSVHEAPDRRAWSTKWPIEVVGDVAEVVGGEHGVGELLERVGVHLLDGVDEVVEADVVICVRIGHASTLG